jgi:putative polyhydroxyalkanoic acid system protein
MRVSISHNKTKQEVMRIVNDATGQVFGAGATGGLLHVSNVEKSWSGSIMTFSLTASFAVMRSLIKGTIEVTDSDVIIDCNLPQLLTTFVQESKIRSSIETKVRGLLG